MITDNHGNTIDDATALHHLVVAHDLRLSQDSTPATRVCRLLATLGGLAAAIVTVERGASVAPEGVNPGAVLTKALYDVLRATGGIAHHYRLPVRLPNGKTDPVNPFVLLARLIQAAGTLAQLVDQALRTRRREDEAMASPVDLVMSRTLVLAERYGLRHDLRGALETLYRKEQSEGFLR